MLPVIERAARVVGGIGKLAILIDASRSAMYEWVEVPRQFVIPIERAQRSAIKSAFAEVVTREEMRPDLYPPKKRLTKRERARA